MKRKIDELGRIVIPKEMRKELDIKENDPLNIEVQDNKIIITKPDTVDYKAIVKEAREYLLKIEAFQNSGIGFYELKAIDVLKILNENKD